MASWFPWQPDIDPEKRDPLIGGRDSSTYPYETGEVEGGMREMMGGPLSQEEALIVQLGLISMALQIVVGKRRNYSGTEDPFRNFRTSAMPWGVEPFEGAGVRMMDKWARTRSILEMGEQVDMGPEPQEKLLSDWSDAHNYTDIIAGLILENLPDRDALLKELREHAVELPEVVQGLLDIAGLVE